MSELSERELDSAFAADLAEQAGTLLLDLQRTSGLSGKELGKAGDAKSNELLLGLLEAGRPGDAVLSEESADSPARLSADRVWIIDPLDGTREYGMEGRSDWAVHVALWERGASASAITAAAVAQPALSTVYSTGGPTATWPTATPDLPGERQPTPGVRCSGGRGSGRGPAANGVGRGQGDGRTSW